MPMQLIFQFLDSIPSCGKSQRKEQKYQKKIYEIMQEEPKTTVDFIVVININQEQELKAKTTLFPWHRI